jgi:hypothetical protein
MPRRRACAKRVVTEMPASCGWIFPDTAARNRWSTSGGTSGWRSSTSEGWLYWYRNARRTASAATSTNWSRAKRQTLRNHGQEVGGNRQQGLGERRLRAEALVEARARRRSAPAVRQHVRRVPAGERDGPQQHREDPARAKRVRRGARRNEERRRGHERAAGQRVRRSRRQRGATARGRGAVKAMLHRRKRCAAVLAHIARSRYGDETRRTGEQRRSSWRWAFGSCGCKKRDEGLCT